MRKDTRLVLDGGGGLGTLGGMPRPTPRSSTDHDHDTDSPHERQPNGATAAPDWAEHVRNLQSGERVYVYRTAPVHLKGYMGIVTLPGERFEDLLETIKGSWGGGTYRIQRYTPEGNFARGGATIDIGGPPIVEADRRPPAAMAPVVWQAPAPAASGDTTGVVQALAGLVQSLSSQAGQHAAPQDQATGLAGLVQLAQHLTGVRPADPFEQFERFAKLFRMMGGGGSRRDDDDDEGDGLNLGSLLKVAARGMSMGGQPPPQPTAPTAQWNGTTWIYTGAVPPNVPPPQTLAPQAPAPAPNPVDVAEASGGEDEWEDVPITAADVAEHVQSLDESQARSFLADVMQRLGVELPG